MESCRAIVKARFDFAGQIPYEVAGSLDLETNSLMEPPQ